MFLVATTPAGEALLDHQLYLPKEWIKDRARRKKARVPQQVQFQTKPQLAAELIRRTVANGHLHFDWIVADDHYGENGGFLDALEARQQRYMVETPVSTMFWVVDPATQIPEGGGSGRLELLAQAGATRFRVELFFEEAKGELGMGHYEARAWTSWHHHMALVSMAHLFATLVRRECRAGKETLTLRQSFDLKALSLRFSRAITSPASLSAPKVRYLVRAHTREREKRT